MTGAGGLCFMLVLHLADLNRLLEDGLALRRRGPRWTPKHHARWAWSGRLRNRFWGDCAQVELCLIPTSRLDGLLARNARLICWIHVVYTCCSLSLCWYLGFVPFMLVSGQCFSPLRQTISSHRQASHFQFSFNHFPSSDLLLSIDV